MAITDRREIEFDLQAVRLALEWSPRSAQAFGLPPLTPHAVRCNPAEGTIEVTYGELTSTRVFVLRGEALGAILICVLQPRRHADAADRRQGRADRARTRRDRVHAADRGRAATGSTRGTISRVPEAVRAWSWIEVEH